MRKTWMCCYHVDHRHSPNTYILQGLHESPEKQTFLGVQLITYDMTSLLVFPKYRYSEFIPPTSVFLTYHVDKYVKYC